MSVQMRSILSVADNSGARKLQVILPLGGGLGKKAHLGDVVTAAVKESSPDGTVKKGKVVKAVIVRLRKEARRRDGTGRTEGFLGQPHRVHQHRRDVRQPQVLRETPHPTTGPHSKR